MERRADATPARENENWRKSPSNSAYLSLFDEGNERGKTQSKAPEKPH